MRGFEEFVKIAAPVFQQWTPTNRNKGAFNDFKFQGDATTQQMVNGMQKIKQPVNREQVTQDLIDSIDREKAVASGYNRAMDNPKSKYGKRLAKNQKFSEKTVKPMVDTARQNNNARAEASMAKASGMMGKPNKILDALKNNKKLQAGVVGGSLLAAGAITAKKVYDNQKKKKAQQQANAYAMQQAYQQPTYQPATPYPAQQETPQAQY